MFASREEKSGKLWRAINNDNVLECQKMENNSVDLIVTSIPFSNHYEYTPTYNDFGHNEDNSKFFEQMDYLTPELMRILKPGRLACIHVKDRVLFGNATGDGMPTIDPFSEMTVFHYMKHGFRYMGRITVDTDVVRRITRLTDLAILKCVRTVQRWVSVARNMFFFSASCLLIPHEPMLIFRW